MQKNFIRPTVFTIVLVDFEIQELKGSDKFIQHVMLKDDENKKFRNYPFPSC